MPRPVQPTRAFTPDLFEDPSPAEREIPKPPANPSPGVPPRGPLTEPEVAEDEPNPGHVTLRPHERVRVCPVCHAPAIMQPHPRGGLGHPRPYTIFAHHVTARSGELLVALYHHLVEGVVS